MFYASCSTQHASLFSRFSFASPKEKLQKKRGQAKMLPYTLAGARPAFACCHPAANP